MVYIISTRPDNWFTCQMYLNDQFIAFTTGWSFRRWEVRGWRWGCLKYYSALCITYGMTRQTHSGWLKFHFGIANGIINPLLIRRVFQPCIIVKFFGWPRWFAFNHWWLVVMLIKITKALDWFGSPFAHIWRVVDRLVSNRVDKLCIQRIFRHTTQWSTRFRSTTSVSAISVMLLWCTLIKNFRLEVQQQWQVFHLSNQSSQI